MENNEQTKIPASKYQKLRYKPITNKLRIGIDIGGTLTKICIVLTKQHTEIISVLTEENVFELVETPSHVIFFYKFQTVKFQADMLPIIQSIYCLILNNNI